LGDWNGGYLCFFVLVFFQPGAVFLAICFILELAKICVLHAFWSQNLSFACPLGFWLLVFGFWLLALASLGFTWLHLAYGSWLLVFGFGFTWLFFGRSLHLALGVRWVLVL
jgi:hypothetical protein